jgi:transcriptional regulator with XRE-family HTH domain
MFVALTSQYRHLEWQIIDRTNLGALRMKDPQPFYKEVGRRIREARLQRQPRLTQQGLADLVSLTRTSITNVEKGRQKFLLHTLADIAKALDVDPASLLPESNVQPDQRLDSALKNRSRAEKEWIRSAVSASQRERNDNGS